MGMPIGAANEGQPEKNSQNGNCESNGQNAHCAFEDLDHSILQQPLNLGINNVKQILHCIQSGTREIKDLILNECNIIYECKACLSLFRSLANLMYHKRCYCKKHLCEDMVLFDGAEEKTHTEDIVIQPNAPDEKDSDDIITNLPEIQECSVSVIRTDLPNNDLITNESEDLLESDATENSTMAKEVAWIQEKAEVIKKIGKEMQAGKFTAIPTKHSDFDIDLMETDNDPDPDPILITRRDIFEGSETEVMTTAAEEDLTPESTSTPNPMVSRRTRDKNNRETFSAVIAKTNLEQSMSSAEPVLFKLIPKNPNMKNAPYTTQLKKQQFSFITKKDGKISKIKTGRDKDIFPAITLKTINSSPNAVYQACDKKSFVARSSKPDSSSQVQDNEKLIIVVANKEITSESSPEKKTKVRRVMKQSEFHLTRRKRLLGRSDCDVQDLRCLVCKTQFMSLKTLFFHMMSLHSKKRQYYPCPFCKTLFVQIYGVTRHLQSIHKKTKEQISKLKETVKKKVVWRKVDDVTENGEKLVEILSQQVHKEEETIVEQKKEFEATPSDTPLQSDDKKLTLHKCSKCGRVFGRKSSQVSHEKFCIMNAIKLETTPKSDQPTTSFPPISPPIISIMPVSPNRPSPIKQSPLADVKLTMRPKRGAEKQMHKDFVNSQTLKWRSANKVDTNNQVIPVSKKITGKNVEKRVMNIINSQDLSCIKCNKKFSSFSNLRRHAAIHVGWTRFKCKYCDYQAYNKSQCWLHVQKTHSVTESELDKSVVSLACSNPAMNKQSPSSRLSPKSSQSHKQNPVLKIKPNANTPIRKMKICKVKSSTDSQKNVKFTVQKAKNSKFTVQKPRVSPKNAMLQIKNITMQKTGDSSKNVKLTLQKTSDSLKNMKFTVQKANDSPKNAIVQTKNLAVQKTSESTKSAIIHIKSPIVQKIILNDIGGEIKNLRPAQIRRSSVSESKKEISNYKSVTTSNPTTIILSKKIPHVPVQPIAVQPCKAYPASPSKAAVSPPLKITVSPAAKATVTPPATRPSTAPLSSPAVSSTSTEKISPTRTSPRKSEQKAHSEGNNSLTSLVTRSSAYRKSSLIIPIKSPEEDKVANQQSPEKMNVKRDRLISEWFPKKDMVGLTRRDSAPLIIGLVPASSSSVTMRAKNSVVPNDRGNS